MPLSKEAIEHIQADRTIQKIIEQLQLPSTQSGMVAVPSHISLKDCEHLLPIRRGYRANFETKTIKDFVKYIEAHNVEKNMVLECMIDKDRMKSSVVFDAGHESLPLHANHKAMLQLQMTANFKKLLDVNGDQMDQKKLAEFLEDYAENIQAFDSSGAAMTPVAAAQSVRKLTVEQIRSVNSEVSDFGRSLTAAEAIEMKAQGQMPSAVKFTCDPYYGLDNRSIEMRISSNTSRDTPTLTLTIKKLDELEEQIADELVAKLEDQIEAQNIVMYLGSITY